MNLRVEYAAIPGGRTVVAELSWRQAGLVDATMSGTTKITKFFANEEAAEAFLNFLVEHKGAEFSLVVYNNEQPRLYRLTDGFYWSI